MKKNSLFFKSIPPGAKIRFWGRKTLYLLLLCVFFFKKKTCYRVKHLIAQIILICTEPLCFKLTSILVVSSTVTGVVA